METNEEARIVLSGFNCSKKTLVSSELWEENGRANLDDKQLEGMFPFLVNSNQRSLMRMRMVESQKK